MTRPPHALSRFQAILLVVLALPGLPATVRAQPPDPTAAAVARALVEAGFENVSVVPTDSTWMVRYENRVDRWDLPAVGRVAATCLATGSLSGRLVLVPLTRGVPVIALGAGADDWRRYLAGLSGPAEFRDRLAITPPPAAATRTADAPAPANRSRGRIDLAVRPLLDLQLGIADDPFQTSLAVAPELTVSPARGLLVTLQARQEVQDDLDDFNSPLEPGRNTLSWNERLPGGIEVAASAGTFPDNRYGAVAELARYLEPGGRLEARVGGDWSGFYKYLKSGTISYSDAGAWSGVGTLIGRLPDRDVELAITGGRFLTGDAGVRVDLTRRFGEVDLGFFGISTDAGDVGGFRFSVPLPARHWSRPRAVRPVTVPTFPFEYREDVAPLGRRVRAYDTVDRFRDGLTPVGIVNNLEALRGRSVTARYRTRGLPGRPSAEPGPAANGTTGLIDVPVPYVTPEGTLHAGFTRVPERWAYEGRTTLRNDYWYLTVGLLPWVETSIKATVLPGEYLIDEVPVDAVDRMGSLRIQSPWPRGRTTLGAGIDDLRGTRRYHSFYVVGAQSFESSFAGLGGEAVVGYGLRSLSAPRYLLDGVFGGVRLRLTPWAFAMAEHDSEKWNGGLRVVAFSRLSAQLAMLNFESLSGGASWSVRF
jgi:hypothetical protein